MKDKTKKTTAKALAAALAISTVAATAAQAGDNTPKPNIPNQPMHKSIDKKKR